MKNIILFAVDTFCAGQGVEALPQHRRPGGQRQRQAQGQGFHQKVHDQVWTGLQARRNE